MQTVLVPYPPFCPPAETGFCRPLLAVGGRNWPAKP